MIAAKTHKDEQIMAENKTHWHDTWPLLKISGAILLAALIFSLGSCVIGKGCRPWISVAPNILPFPRPHLRSTLLIVIDPRAESPACAEVYTSPDLRKYFDSSKDSLRIVGRTPENKPDNDALDLRPYLAAANDKPVPWIVIGRSRRVLYDGPLPASTALLLRIFDEQTAKTAEEEEDATWDGIQFRPLGCLPPRPGTADRWPKYGDRSTEKIIPRSEWIPVDFRHLCPPIVDQDGMSSCCACAATRAMATALERHGYHRDTLSVVDLYSRINNGRDAGATLEDALAALTSLGVCTTDTAELHGITTTDAQHRGDWAAERGQHRILLAEWCEDVEQIGSAIQRRKPVCIGIMIGATFQPDAENRIGPKTGRTRGGHAMYLVGARPDGKDWYFLVVNSWGEKWGDNGTAWLHESWLKSDWCSAWSITLPHTPSDDQSAQDDPRPASIHPAKRPKTCSTPPRRSARPWQYQFTPPACPNCPDGNCPQPQQTQPTTTTADPPPAPIGPPETWSTETNPRAGRATTLFPRLANARSATRILQRSAGFPRLKAILRP